MSQKKVTFGKKVKPHVKNFLNQTIEQIKIEQDFKTDDDALEWMCNNMTFEPFSSTSQTIDPNAVVTLEDIEIQKLCEIGVLQKLNLEGRERWYCLETKKPLFLGKDLETIRKQCIACRTRNMLDRQKQVLIQREKAILELGERGISYKLYACRNIDISRIETQQIRIGTLARFFCPSAKREATIKHTCLKNHCHYLYELEFTMPLEESEPFKEFKEKLIEGPQ